MTTSRRKDDPDSLFRTLWNVMEMTRASESITDRMATVVAPLAGLLVLRWAAFTEAEMEAVCAFNDTPFVPMLPESLRQASWGDAHGLAARLSTGLLEIAQSRDATIGRYVCAAAPAIFGCAERHREVFAVIVEWVRGLPFDKADGRETAAAAFDDLLADVVEGQGKFGGVYTTPQPVAELMLELVDPRAGDRVYDPCFGVGGLLVEAARRLRKAVAIESPRRWGEVRDNGQTTSWLGMLVSNRI